MTPANARTAYYKSDLRRLTVMVGAALALLSAALVVVVAYAGWSANRAAVERERQLVENALDQSVSRVLDQQKAIAWWDDAVINAQARPLDLEWIETNIGLYFYETYGHDEILIVDADNQPIYANVGGELTDAAAAYARHAAVFDQMVAEARSGTNNELRRRDRAFRESNSNYSALLGASFGRWAGHIMMMDGEPAVVAALSIVPNIDASLVEGAPHLLLSVVKVDQTFMNEVGGSLLISDLTASETPERGSGILSQPFMADDGAEVGYLNWTPRRPGRTLLMFLLPLVALSVVSASVFTWVMINRLKNASNELHERERKAQHEAKHDQLSGLPNRRFFTEALQDALDELVQERSDRHVAVAYVDVDRFKDINDTLGHQAGDALIMSVAERLRSAVEPGDVLARFGGDEFAIMRRAGSVRDAGNLVKRLRAAFDVPFFIHGQAMRISSSIGVAMAPEHGMSPDEMMRNADIALYQSKGHGRDRAMLFTAEMSAQVERRREIEVELHAAIERGDLHLHYQPLVSCADNRIRGVEALLRWRHPTRGFISPAAFVPVAEESGLMPLLGAYVIERALAESRRWPDIDVAINLSPVQFRHVDLVQLLERLIAKYQVDPSRVVLEVTEGVMMESTERNRNILDAIRALGFKIALDDFGTGYSSLRYLCDFRFDKIKIDRAFVTGVHERRRSMTIIQSVVTLGRGLGMDIVAEGVETEAEAAVMRLAGVSELQGFYFSKPIPAAGIDALLQRFNATPVKAGELALRQRAAT